MFLKQKSSKQIEKTPFFTLLHALARSFSNCGRQDRCRDLHTISLEVVHCGCMSGWWGSSDSQLLWVIQERQTAYKNKETVALVTKDFVTLDLETERIGFVWSQEWAAEEILEGEIEEDDDSDETVGLLLLAARSKVVDTVVAQVELVNVVFYSDIIQMWPCSRGAQWTGGWPWRSCWSNSWRRSRTVTTTK